MATIHPSRAKIVPSDEARSSGSKDDEREKELRQRLERSRDARRGGQDEDARKREEDYARPRRGSPSYGAYGDSVSVQGRSVGWDSQEHGREDSYNHDRRKAQHFYEDRSGVPPPGAWGQRDTRSRALVANNNNEGGFFASRQEQRKQSSFSIWPPSPTSPYRPLEEKDKDRKRKSSSSRHKSQSDRHESRRHHRSRRYDSDEEDSDRERERRHKKRDERRRHRSRSPRRSRDEQDEEDEERRRRRKRREKEREREYEYRKDDDEDRSSRRHRHSTRRTSEDEGKSEEERGKSNGKRRTEEDRRENVDAEKPASEKHEPSPHVDDDRASTAVRQVGPQLPTKPTSEANKTSNVDARAYGKALLPGEGSAMANFVQDGQRIPRRGEIGLSSDQIEAYENAGFVMSGSRHQRMNAVRMRKENQIYSAEEQRAMLKMIAEEKQKKEAMLVEQFKDMVNSMD